METNKFGESEIPWMEDDFLNPSTSLPEIIAQETNQVGTVVIFVVSAILTITLLFIIAIFIDCRQQKLADLKQKQHKRFVRMKVPRIGKPVRDDKQPIADRMEECQPSSSAMIV